MAIVTHSKDDLNNCESMAELRKKTKFAASEIEQHCPRQWEIISFYIRALTVPVRIPASREEAADLYSDHFAYVKLAKDLNIL